MRATKPTAVRPDEAADPQFFPFPDDGGGRRLRAALVVAVLFHALLLALPTPETDAAPPAPEPRKILVMQQVRFKPPPPPPPEPIPDVRATLIPVPDPTPDDPEPLRDLRQLTVPTNLPIGDIIFDDVKPPPVEDAGPIPVGGKVARPQPISTPKPVYTEMARKARIQGIVIVQLILDKNGRVTNAKALKPLPMGLTEATLDTVREWRYEPATLNGKPVDVYMSITVTFTLQ